MTSTRNRSERPGRWQPAADWRLAGLWLGVLALAACSDAGNGAAQQSGPGGAMATAPAEVGTGDTDESSFTQLSPQEFVDQASASDLFEIQAGQIAADRASSGEVRNFANIMVQEHDRAQARLKTAISATDIGLRYAPRLTAEQQAQLDALRAAGANFDALYVRQQRAAHEKALGMLHAYAMTGEVQPLREHAQNASEEVAKHLTRAELLPAGEETAS